jgi:Squalene-hopene cyclase C-terminal domain
MRPIKKISAFIRSFVLKVIVSNQNLSINLTKCRLTTASKEVNSLLVYSSAEKKQLLAFARAILSDPTATVSGFKKFYTNYEHENSLPSNGGEVGIVVDVILWVDGHLRGSQYVEGKPLLESLYEAVIRSCADTRFKPISSREYERVRIEVVIISPVLLPIGKSELAQNEINPEYAYLGVSVEGRRGWFVPATLNCRVFKDLDHYLRSLSEEKLHISSKEIKSVQFYKAVVTDFIDSYDHGSAIALAGVRVMDTASTEVVKEELVAQALDFLLRIQDEDGNFAPIISPFTIGRPVVDWVRSAFQLYALSLACSKYPHLTKKNAYQAAADASYLYLKSHLYNNKSISNMGRCLGLIYLYKVACLRSEQAECQKLHTIIVDLFAKLPYEPILFTQYGIHILSSQLSRTEEVKLAVQAVEKVLADFTHRQETNSWLELALYADLPNALKNASIRTGNKILSKAGEAAYHWFLRQQKADGSFVGMVGLQFAYTRGTGKVLEALAVYGLPDSDPVFQKTLQWLNSLQYTQENSYFVPKDLQGKILGSFRHDEQNATVWLDSSAHYLVAISI